MPAHYLILPCQYLEPEPMIFVVATRAGLVRLQDPAAQACARRLLDLGWGETVSAQQLASIQREAGVENADALAAFLVEIAVLRPVAAPWRRFRRLRTIDWPRGGTDAVKPLEEDLPFLTGIPLAPCDGMVEVQPDEFVVLHLRTYDPDLIDSLQRQVRATRTAAMIAGYYVERTLVVDAPYVPAAATPCHFCQQEVSRIPRVGSHRHAPTWMQAVHSLGLPPSAICGLEHPLRATDYLQGQLLLRNRVLELLGPAGRPPHAGIFFEALQTNLDDLATQRDIPALHMECDRCLAA